MGEMLVCSISDIISSVADLQQKAAVLLHSHGSGRGISREGDWKLLDDHLHNAVLFLQSFRKELASFGQGGNSRGEIDLSLAVNLNEDSSEASLQAAMDSKHNFSLTRDGGIYEEVKGEGRVRWVKYGKKVTEGKKRHYIKCQFFRNGCPAKGTLQVNERGMPEVSVDTDHLSHLHSSEPVRKKRMRGEDNIFFPTVAMDQQTAEIHFHGESPVSDICLKPNTLEGMVNVEPEEYVDVDIGHGAWRENEESLAAESLNEGERREADPVVAQIMEELEHGTCSVGDSSSEIEMGYGSFLGFYGDDDSCEFLL